MKLGPSRLKLTHRAVINRKENKALINSYLNGDIEWFDKSLSKIKKQIRIILRKEQDNRCIYCRRIIKGERRNSTEDIEHFLDKSKQYYKKWAFSPLNLTLACHPCNMVKSTKDLGDMTLRQARKIQNGIGQFKWLHPYFDDYHDNIEINEGWLYSVKNNAPNVAAASKMISDCELDKIEKIEEASEYIKKRQERITMLISTALEKERYERAKKLTKWLKSEQKNNWFNY
ncbi:hypothetical protein ACEUAY_07655 [Aeromonas veronii]|uniref:hypothetical protein n=1 Tax=Aeromonas TaxID=642 RepID=UPI0013167624|nr:hypothetical protein [Aeromonas veronii]QHC07446.1 hypothetical protein GRF56_08445 [Aeromonas veronii]